MSFWKRRKQAPSPTDAGRVQKAKKTLKRSPPVAMEVKILALEALDSGLSAIEVSELVGVGSGTIHKWRKDYAEAGVQGLCRKASSISIRKQYGRYPHLCKAIAAAGLQAVSLVCAPPCQWITCTTSPAALSMSTTTSRMRTRTMRFFRPVAVIARLKSLARVTAQRPVRVGQQ